jgi:hypothetical protein
MENPEVKVSKMKESGLGEPLKAVARFIVPDWGHN